jgi:glutamine synthetase
LYDQGTYTGWHSGFPDADFRIVTATERWLAEEGCPYFIGEFVDPDGARHPLCPRARLGAVLESLDGAGLSLVAGFEYEFFVFAETPHEVRGKGSRTLRPLTPGNFGYSILRTSAQADLFGGLMDDCRGVGCPLEGLHCETGPGVWEGALQAQPGLAAADQAALFKTYATAFMQRHGCMATFMAKWSMAYPGQSGHFHFSLLNDDGTNAFYDADGDRGMGDRQRWAVGGLVRHLPEFLALLAPTINSYTRLVPGAWAPTAATWGVENRTAAVRVIPAGPAGQRIECRVPGADANPYLVAAAVAAAAQAGIEGRTEPPEPVTGNAYDAAAALPPERRFPHSLEAAAARLEGSEAARSAFGEAFVDHFVMSRRFECAEYGRHVNAWQLDRYFEII